MPRLIINADDFGLTAGVNRAITEAHTSGVVTSSTPGVTCAVNNEPPSAKTATMGGDPEAEALVQAITDQILRNGV